MKSQIVLKRHLSTIKDNKFLAENKIEPNIIPRSFIYSNGKNQEAEIQIDVENKTTENINVELSICNHESNEYNVTINGANCFVEKRELMPGINNLKLNFDINFLEKPESTNTDFVIKFEAGDKKRVFTCIINP